MQLTKAQLAFLQQHDPFEALLWGKRLKKNEQQLCCALKLPESFAPHEFTLVFEDLVFAEKSLTKVELHFAIASYAHQFIKKGLRYTFDLTDERQCDLIKLMAQKEYIYVHNCEMSKKKRLYISSCRTHEWRNYMRIKAYNVLGLYYENKNQRVDKEKETENNSENQVVYESSDLRTKESEEVVKQEVSENKVSRNWQPRVVVTRRNVLSQQLQPSMPSLPPSMPLIERCIYQLRKGGGGEPSLWELLLSAGMEQARLFTWEPEALEIIEQKRQKFKEVAVPVLPPEFPYSLLWFEFANSIRTPICPDVAAIYLFSSANDFLYTASTSALKVLSQEACTRLRRDARTYEDDRLSLLVINRQGELVWSMSLPTTPNEMRTFSKRPWLVPKWFRCLQGKCKLLIDAENLGGRTFYWELCPSCKEAQIYFSTWLVTARQALLGQYREATINVNSLDNIGTRRVEHVMDDNAYAWLRAGRVRKYSQIVTYKDISQSLTSWKPEIKHRGSWVEVLKAIDPTLVTEKVQYVAEHKRRFMSERFTNMRGQEITIESFSRSSPVRADLIDVPRKTEVVAKADKNNAKKRRRR